MAIVKNPKLYVKNYNDVPIASPNITFIYDEESGVELSKIADEINLDIGHYKYYVDLVGWKYLGIFITLYDIPKLS